MRPDWRILIDGQDRSEAFRARLLSLTITDESGYYSDTVSVRLDDRDGRIVPPRPGVEMVVQLGYEEIGRVEIGRYTVDEIELSGPAPQDCPFLSVPSLKRLNSLPDGVQQPKETFGVILARLFKEGATDAAKGLVTQNFSSGLT